MTMANRKHQGHPVSEASKQALQRDRLLWGLDELGSTSAMVRNIAGNAQLYGDD